MRRHVTIYGPAVLFMTLSLSMSCDLLPGFFSDSTSRGFVALEFSLNGENTLDIASVRIELEGENSAKSFSKTCVFDGSSRSAYGFIPEVPAGGWNAAVTVYNSAGGVIVSDGTGETFQVVADEILTLAVFYDPAAGEDMTISWSSASSVQSAVAFDGDGCNAAFMLYTSGDQGYTVQDVTILFGGGSFQSASGFTFLYPDGTTVTQSSRTVAGDFRISVGDSSIECLRWGGGYVPGRYEARATDIFGISVSAFATLDVENPSGSLTTSTFPAHGDMGSFDPWVNTAVTWNPIQSPDVQTILVLIVQDAKITTGSPDFISPSLPQGETSVTVPLGTLMGATDYKLIILTLDQWIDDPSAFSSISNFTADPLMRGIVSAPGFDFDCIGTSYSSFRTM